MSSEKFILLVEHNLIIYPSRRFLSICYILGGFFYLHIFYIFRFRIISFVDWIVIVVCVFYKTFFLLLRRNIPPIFYFPPLFIIFIFWPWTLWICVAWNIGWKSLFGNFFHFFTIIYHFFQKPDSILVWPHLVHLLLFIRQLIPKFPFGTYIVHSRLTIIWQMSSISDKYQKGL